MKGGHATDATDVATDARSGDCLCYGWHPVSVCPNWSEFGCTRPESGVTLHEPSEFRAADAEGVT